MKLKTTLGYTIRQKINIILDLKIKCSKAVQHEVTKVEIFKQARLDDFLYAARSCQEHFPQYSVSKTMVFSSS